MVTEAKQASPLAQGQPCSIADYTRVDDERALWEARSPQPAGNGVLAWACACGCLARQVRELVLCYQRWRAGGLPTANPSSTAPGHRQPRHGCSWVDDPLAGLRVAV